MKYALPLMILLAVAACDRADQDQDPRDRVGQDGPLSWRLVEQKSGAAAFLSRPGAAPDLVLWCDDQKGLTLRAHVFKEPAAQPDLLLTTPGGQITFTNVRRQGGLRATDRKLVEGRVNLADPRVTATLAAAQRLTLTSGGVDYQVEPQDRAGALRGFLTACASQAAPVGKNGSTP